MEESDKYSSILKEQHQKLSAVIKGLHRQLRRAYRENNGDHEVVWERHIQDLASLQDYAEAMYCLATQHWAVHPDTRIQWCRQVAVEYFIGGGIYRALEKDMKRKMRHSLSKAANQKASEEFSHTDLTKQTPEEPSTQYNEIEIKKKLEEAKQNVQVNIPVKGRVRLLDVGSCYNPFLECPEFESIGVDLSPATQSVYQCDFLKLELIPSLAHSPSSDDLDLVPLTSKLGLTPEPTASPMTQLPRASFQVVVFSLLLEYLPASVQRWACCVKAHSLLVPHGLLLIVTPDSNSACRNAPMMKSWREALEHLGFQRWKYHKMEHVHCMAFRKVRDELPEHFPESVEKLLYIPQDFSDACYDDDHLPASERRSHSLGVNDPKHDAELETFLLSSLRRESIDLDSDLSSGLQLAEIKSCQDQVKQK
ncbi:hypothetical protein RRG08_003117 [Elysia crispata]|uniref:S-adenosylmethionine sensor upstream of mTORC1 n=1 Tax=Elysia crispata TaxID=231223 RepID=A0AAE1B8A1_9GAST|nr:hypothetical protein RRG08_003117 [Elysia crispata]